MKFKYPVFFSSIRKNGTMKHVFFKYTKLTVKFSVCYTLPRLPENVIDRDFEIRKKERRSMRKQWVAKKVTAVCLCLAMFGSLTACKSQTAAGGNGTTPKGEEKVSENLNPEGLPILKEKETFRILVGQQSTEVAASAKECVQKAAEATNIEVEWIEVPTSSWDEKINILFASNELPDAIIGSIKNISQYYKQLTPLDGYIDEYAPNVKEFFEKRPDYPPALQGVDGQIYGFPIGDESTHNIIDSSMWINSEWLKKTGLPMPKTTDEFKTVLEAFRDGDMNGNGDTTDEIPFTFTTAWGWSSTIENLFGSFGAPESDNHVFISPEDDKTIVFSPEQEGYYKCLAWLHELYEEGLLDKEVFVQSSDQYNSKNAGQDTIGVYMGYGTGGLGNDLVDYDGIPQLTGPDGEQILTLNNVTKGIGFSIPATCKNPAAMVRFYDYLNSDIELVMQWDRGKEGVNWEWAKNDAGETVPSLIYRTVEEWKAMGYDSMTDAKTRESFAGWSPALYSQEIESIVLDIQPEPDKKLMSVKDNLDHGVRGLPAGNASEENAQKRALIITDMDNYLKKFISDSVINGIDDGKWQNHLEQLKRIGSEDYKKLCQEYTDGILSMQ